MSKKKTVAIDFDGTIVENIFPEIGAIKKNVVDKVKKWYEKDIRLSYGLVGQTSMQRKLKSS